MLDDFAYSFYEIENCIKIKISLKNLYDDDQELPLSVALSFFSCVLLLSSV